MDSFQFISPLAARPRLHQLVAAYQPSRSQLRTQAGSVSPNHAASAVMTPARDRPATPMMIEMRRPVRSRSRQASIVGSMASNWLPIHRFGEIFDAVMHLDLKPIDSVAYLGLDFAGNLDRRFDPADTIVKRFAAVAGLGVLLPQQTLDRGQLHLDTLDLPLEPPDVLLRRIFRHD